MELIRRLFWATVIAVMLIAALSVFGYLEPTARGHEKMEEAKAGALDGVRAGTRTALRFLFEKPAGSADEKEAEKAP